MATLSSIVACRIPCTEEPGELQSIGSQRVRHDTHMSTYLFLLIAFQPSLLEAFYVKRLHLHLTKVLYQCYGNLLR